MECLQSDSKGKRFGPKDALTLIITGKNEGKEAVQLSVTEYLGSTAFGAYTYEIRDTRAKKVWQIGRDPEAILPGAPASMRLLLLKAGDTLETKVRLPGVGQRFWQGGKEDAPEKTSSPQLPPGDYEIVVTIKVGQDSAKTKPIPFSIGDK